MLAKHIRRIEGKQAFFLRLEYLKDDFESAFEGGSLGEFSEFQDWKKTNEMSWLFLDSVDEAKLKDPGDFERGLRKLKVQLGDKAQQVKIVITSRLTWEPKTELSLVERLFPYYPEKKSAEKNEVEEEFGYLIHQSENSDSEDKDDVKYPKIYSLTPLNNDQIKAFSFAKGVADTNSFLEAINRADAHLFTSRPQDLTDLIDYWNKHKTIGTRLDLVKHSVEQKLVESDTIRAELSPLTYEKALAGAELIAAVTTLTPFSKVAVPDKKKNLNDILITDILPNWTLKECKALLERPIFDEAVYGTVRFHHRSVREYLAAQWFLRLLGNGSRPQIENLFFRVQYGENVLTPKLRPIVPWMAIFDDQFRQKAIKIAPEVLLEGGDPSQFPAPVRSDILKNLCQDMADSELHHYTFDIAVVERFSKSDIEQTVSHLLDKYDTHSEIRTLLLRMVWRGKLSSCTEQSLSFAKNRDFDKYTRSCAIRAVEGAGTTLEKQELVTYFVNNIDELDHSIINTVVESFGIKELSVHDLFVILDRLPNPGEYNTEGLDYYLIHLVGAVSLSDLEIFAQILSMLLAKKPHIEHIHCDVSQQHSWLMAVAVKSCERLISNRSRCMLKPGMLRLLSQCGNFQDYHGTSSKENSLSDIVPLWSELNEQLFWNDVTLAKADHDREVTEVWQVSRFGNYWCSNIIGFEKAVKWIADKSELRERRIALSLAFGSYVNGGRDQKNRRILKKAVTGIPELEAALHSYLHPPPQSKEQKKWQSQERNLKLRQKQREKKQEQNEKEWRIGLSENINNIVDTQGVAEGHFFDSQRYLYERMKCLGKNRNRNRWACGNWQDLIKDQNKEVAEAYRNFLIACWRQYRPAIHSEEIENINSVSYGVIFGLSGLLIDAMSHNWPTNLTNDEAEHAVRYSLLELNGLPDWLSQLHAVFPEIVENHFLREIEWEITKYDGDKPCYYILDKLAWRGECIRSKLGSSVLKILKNHEPKHTETLLKSLVIIFDSENVNDDDLSELAQNRIKQYLCNEKHAVWFAVWVALRPQDAICELEHYLSSISEASQSTEFAMRFIVNLIGGRLSGIKNMPQKFKQVEHLAKLYLMMHRYICISEDIDRSGKGVYSPGLRDDAQKARDSLFSMLKEIPGKSTFLALKRVASEHPHESVRSWIHTTAKSRAEQDADIGVWNVKNVIEFADTQECQPKNAKQLYELSVRRLLDLKDELENSDDSVAPTWQRETEETKLRILIAKWLRDHSSMKYSVHQEEEQADAKRPDIRTHGYGFDTPVIVELKIADKWSGNELFERLENQLCNDYLRDYRTTYGIFLLVYRGEKQKWDYPDKKERMDFINLLETLQKHAKNYISNRAEIDNVSVIGIDLTARLKPVRVDSLLEEGSDLG